MRILVVSDLHGALESARAALDHFEPDLLLCCGDWGDPEQVSEVVLATFPARLPLFTTFGNHDPFDILSALRNRDGSAVLFGQGEVRALDGLRVAAIGGIWAKSHKRPYYVTDDDVDEAAARIAANGPVDILLTHACPVGLADLTPKGRHGGQRCFLRAFETIEPKVQVCGHLHRAQEHTLKDGRQVFNVGATPAGTVVLIETLAKGLSASLERFSPGGMSSA